MVFYCLKFFAVLAETVIKVIASNNAFGKIEQYVKKISSQNKMTQ